ncbi:MAG: Rieske 2Fe-2S domain-containing protein [Anaerolineales bacterium]|nr:Rieske 2Fe-2S domain-containing protein [Anaerolineales bacterium]
MMQKSAIETTPSPVSLTRREFLNYLWGISMVMFMAGSGGAVIWFALPRFRKEEFDGVFTIPLEEAPLPDAGPKEFADGRFWLVNIGPETTSDPRQPEAYPLQPGLCALYKVCTHLGCLYRWTAGSNRFKCPCHGSKFLKTGSRIDGPARRNLDVFIIEALNESGKALARTEPSMNSKEGTALEIPPSAVSLRIDTGTESSAFRIGKRAAGYEI